MISWFPNIYHILSRHFHQHCHESRSSNISAILPLASNFRIPPSEPGFCMLLMEFMRAPKPCDTISPTWTISIHICPHLARQNYMSFIGCSNLTRSVDPQITLGYSHCYMWGILKLFISLPGDIICSRFYKGAECSQFCRVTRLNRYGHKYASHRVSLYSWIIELQMVLAERITQVSRSYGIGQGAHTAQPGEWLVLLE